MHSLAGLLVLAERHAQGPSPTFDRAHLLLAFATVGDSNGIGRKALAISSGLGEGAIRTLLKKLREEGYVDADRSGAHLTKGGQRLYESIGRRISKSVLLSDNRLTMGRTAVALVAKGRGVAVKGGIEQRDSAIKVGASGATTYVMKGGRFTIPGGSSDCEKDFPSTSWAKLRKELNPEDTDAVILCGADSEVKAKLGALAAALTLL